MPDRTIFEKLADTLPEKERKDLLTKISRSMNFGAAEDEAIYHKEMSVDERDVLIKQDLDRLSLVSRFLLWLQGLVSGKNRKDLLIGVKIRALKAAINRKCPGLTGFETRDLTPKLAEAFFELYEMTVPLRGIYRNLLLKSKDMEGVFVRLLEQKVPKTRVSLQDVVSMQALESVYDEKGAEQAVKRAALQKLDEFVDGLDSKTFDAVEASILPVFLLKDVVFFPYAQFFDLFHMPLRAVVPERPPVFQSASAMLAIELLEKMYAALYAALKIPASYEVSQDVLRYLIEVSHGSAGSGDGAETAASDESDEPSGAGETGLEGSGSEAFEGDAQALLVDLKKLHEGVRKFEKRIPLVELIRYFLKDPYYKLYLYVPRLKLKEYYLAVVKMRFIAELDQLGATIKSRVIESKIERLFKGEQRIEFENYREYKNIDYENLGLPFFSHIRSLSLIYNFIRWYYHGYLQELVKILSTVILAQNRVTRNKLLLHATTVEDLEEKIKEFDNALSPDSEEGKVFHRLRTTLGGDPAHQRMFRTIVLQRDVQVNGLIERSRDALTGLQKVFEEVVTTPSEAVRERLGSKFYLNGKLQPLDQLLKDRAEYIKQFSSILLQVLKLEGT